MGRRLRLKILFYCRFRLIFLRVVGQVARVGAGTSCSLIHEVKGLVRKPFHSENGGSL